MEKVKKIKLFLGSFYLIMLGFFFFFFFSNFSLQEITSYEFIKNNRDYFFQLKQSNLFLIGILFIIFTIIWVLAAGFGSPVAIFAGFVFGKWLGVLFLLIGLTIGATGLYIFANYFLKDIIRDKFLKKFKKLEIKFKKSEFLYLLIYRNIGGIPFALSNVLPCIFNVKPFNFFWATFFGLTPHLFIVCSIGEGLEKVIDNNSEPPSIIDLITTSEIYIPIILFFGLLIITIFLKKFFYK
tara:strand:- start:83 stop:799 length:717 start_codon:yes stop_codon:yes gene_type:complete